MRRSPAYLFAAAKAGNIAAIIFLAEDAGRIGGSERRRTTQFWRPVPNHIVQTWSWSCPTIAEILS